MSELSTDESRLISVLRAIKELDHESLSTRDASEVLHGLGTTFGTSGLEKFERELSPSELNVLYLGFAGGVACALLTQQPPSDEYLVQYPETDLPPLAEDDPAQRIVSGGFSNGIPAGQAEGDGRFVKQTGPQEDKTG